MKLINSFLFLAIFLIVSLLKEGNADSGLEDDENQSEANYFETILMYMESILKAFWNFLIGLRWQGFEEDENFIQN